MNNVSEDSCQHPEALLYVLLYDPTILWCRGCGSIKGWRPRDQVAAFKDGWQPPDTVLRKSSRETTSGLVPWPADKPARYNACTDPCDMWTGPCCCGATHREGR